MLLLCAAALACGGPERKPARLDYRVECVIDGEQDRLEVELKVAGLDPVDRDVAFELPLWGDWQKIDDYYVTRVEGQPPVHHDLLNRMFWRPELPAEWDGTLSIRYAIPLIAFGSVARESIALTPWHQVTAKSDYVHGYSLNTLMRVMVGEARQDADRHVVLIAPNDWSVATGWGGVTKERQEIALAPTADNTSILFGRPLAVRVSEIGRVEVAQFGGVADRSEAVLDLATRVRAAYAATTGFAHPAEEHLYITEPGLGGTHTDGSISMGHPALEANGRFDVGTANFIAHELFHAWLPATLAPAEPRLEWFFEGFTEYFSLWHLAHAGLITPQQFVDQLRLFDHIARESAAYGKVAFADRTVNWREPDAEKIAYQGGALFAFFIDEATRRAGKPGLPQLFRDLMSGNGGKYSLAAIEAWCAKNGAAELWSRAAVVPALPDVIEALVRLGCVETREGEARIIKVPTGALDSFLRFQARAFAGDGALVAAGTVPLANVSGRIDHLAFDAERGHLIVCALGNGSVEIVDVAKGSVVKSLTKLEEPQGVVAIPARKQFAVASGGDGKLHVFDAETLAEVKTLDAGDDADNVRLDPKKSDDPQLAKLWVACGAGLAAFSGDDWKRVATVKLAGHAESFQLESDGPRLFANVPGARHVAVVDREKNEVVATWPLDGASSNYPMALDEKGGRLYVGCRSPAQVVVLDTKSGKVVAKAPIGDDCDDLFLDAERERLYATCGEGCISVVTIAKDGALAATAKVETASGARTSLFVPSLAKLFVAVPKRGGSGAELRIFSVSGAR